MPEPRILTTIDLGNGFIVHGKFQVVAEEPRAIDGIQTMKISFTERDLAGNPIPRARNLDDEWTDLQRATGLG